MSKDLALEFDSGEIGYGLEPYYGLVLQDGGSAGIHILMRSREPTGTAEERAKRIVACVNALSGITDPQKFVESALGWLNNPPNAEFWRKRLYDAKGA